MSSADGGFGIDRDEAGLVSAASGTRGVDAEAADFLATVCTRSGDKGDSSLGDAK